MESKSPVPTAEAMIVLRGPTKLLALSILFALLAAPAALARTYYVSPQGSNSNSGTSESSSWRTVDRVNKQQLGPGDTVLFQGGATYSDDTLMPGYGHDVSGDAGNPIVFGSYGSGRPALSQGIWFRGESHLVFENFQLLPGHVINATGDDITIQGFLMRHFMQPEGIPIIAYGSNWTIKDNTIDQTADSGMQLNGDHYLVTGNRITHTGVDHSLSYMAHGIYLKASDSTITNNTIISFREEGISVRYRGSTIKDNFISGGNFGIGFHEYDPQSSTSYWEDNTIKRARTAAIYVSPWDVGGHTHENFVISGNQLFRPHRHGRRAGAASSWRSISLSHQSGWYRVSANAVH